MKLPVRKIKYKKRSKPTVLARVRARCPPGCIRMCTSRIKSAPIRSRDTIPRDWPGLARLSSACLQLYDRPKKETARPAERNIESRPENTSERKGLTGSRVIYDSAGYWPVKRDNLYDPRKFEGQGRRTSNRGKKIISSTKEYERIYLPPRDTRY